MLARLKLIHKSPLQSFIHSTNIHWVPHSVPVHPQGCNHIPWSYRVWGLMEDRMEGRSYSKGSLNFQRRIFICVTILPEATLKYRLWVLISKTMLKRWKIQALIHTPTDSNRCWKQCTTFGTLNVHPHKGNRIRLVSRLRTCSVNGRNLSLSSLDTSSSFLTSPWMLDFSFRS